MTTSTPYLNLTLYDSTTDQAVTFATFRAVWGGTATTSNFYKIDTFASTTNTRLTTLESTQPPITVPALFISSNFYQATGITQITAYNTGMTIIISVDTTSSGTVTLDINSLGTKSLMKVDSTGTPINLTGSDLVKGRKYLFTYDGTRWLWVSANSADQIQIVGTSGNVVLVGSTNNLDGSTSASIFIGNTTHNATAKTTPVDNDEVPLLDSAASYAFKKLTWSNIKATLKTYFDTLYTIAASTTVSGIVELATSSEIDTGTDSTRAIVTDQFVASKRNVRHLMIRCIPSNTDWSADGSTAVGGDFRSPITGTMIDIWGYDDTAGVTGTAVVDVNKNGTTIMTTDKIKWDSGEKNSRDYSGTPPALTTTAISLGDILTVDIDTNQTTKGKGLTIVLSVRES